MNQKSVRITGVLTALSALAVAAIAAIAVSSSGLLSAQSSTATIDLLNVGMCVTTDDSVFKESDCDDGDGGDTFTVGDRDELVERETVYATYAHDPITASERPRAILTNSDLVKVTITDRGRDRRRSVLYPAAISDTTQYNGLITNATDDPVVAKIKSLIGDSSFAEKLTDEDNISAFSSENIILYQPRATNNAAVIRDSGTATLNFKRTMQEDFLPLSEDEDNDVVLFFGFEVDEPAGSGSLKLTSVDTAAKAITQVENLKILGAGSAQSLIADEDRSSGGGDTPPWLSILANVTTGKDLVIVAVLYETSDAEAIDGNTMCSVPLTVPGSGPTATATTNTKKCAPNAEQSASEPNYSSSEISGRQALVAKVQGDNGEGAQNLYLKETGRFTGKYTGYIRITDADGDGRDTGTSPKDWGLNFRDGQAATNDDLGAAIVGVQSGPATITYKDSSGATRTMGIEIDIQPPTITIASPVHNSSGDDRSPDFIGTFEDGGAGLADDTFKLYVDNKTDGGPGKVGESLKDSDPVLDLPTSNLAGPASGLVRTRSDYRYSGTPAYAELFGVISGLKGTGTGSIYFTEEGENPEASETDNDALRKVVNADIYDDGDGQGTFDDDARYEGDPSNGREIAVDFQALVIDLAGNIGFSDADTATPRFINDLGTKSTDRGPEKFHNVLGWYNRHVFNLDDKDPEFLKDNTITGYFSLDPDGDPVPHRRGIMITFDNDISQDNITENTFDVELDDGSKALVHDVRVEGKLVFLRLGADLKTSETPKISIASGRRIEDLAGNQLHGREVKAFEAKDGVPPTLTVSLSNGSGTGEGNESSASLTRNTIVVSVTSDEALQGAPYFAAVCSNFRYAASGSTVRNQDINDFAEERSGRLTTNPINNPPEGRCGTASTSPALTPSPTQMNSRPGLNWEYTWRDLGGENAVPEGELRVVVLGRDKSQYKITDATTAPNNYNWGSATAKFSYDTTLNPLIKGSTVDRTAGRVLPEPNQKVSESRPFIMLNFSGETTEVEIERLQVDDVDVTAQVETNARNQFIYWPEGLNFGSHSVEVDARDAAGNEATFQYEFEVVTRSPFVVRLLAGWNAVSLPQQPIDGSLEAAFSDPAIDQVVSYLRPNKDDRPLWLLATRQDGVWTTNYGDLTDVSAGLGYWVHTSTFVNQSIPLRSPERLGPDLPVAPVGITTFEGWNFVGVVDQDGDQTQNDWGQSLKQGDVVQTGRMYLGSYVRAYTWDSTRSQFEALEPTDDIEIGDGIWVYYGEGVAP